VSLDDALGGFVLDASALAALGGGENVYATTRAECPDRAPAANPAHSTTKAPRAAVSPFFDLIYCHFIPNRKTLNGRQGYGRRHLLPELL
jgi:hypothetical protein